jgi:hypothetical protein
VAAQLAASQEGLSSMSGDDDDDDDDKFIWIKELSRCDLKRSNYSFVKLRLSPLSTVDDNSVFRSFYNVDGVSVAMDSDILPYIPHSRKRSGKEWIYTVLEHIYGFLTIRQNGTEGKKLWRQKVFIIILFSLHSLMFAIEIT